MAEHNVDICIYGATSGGVIAAVQASCMGKEVILIEPGYHLGGMTTSGLGWVDHGEVNSIGGLTRAYFDPEFDGIGSRGKDVENGWSNPWALTPALAEQRFRQMLEQAEVNVIYGERILRGPKSVVKNDDITPKISTVTLESGRIIRAKQYIDASYEGDLMAEAGVSWRNDRESAEEYGEHPLAGALGPEVKQPQQFDLFIDPYRVKEIPESGLLEGIQDVELGASGSSDHKLQAYCFRLCLTSSTDPMKRVEITEPEKYRPEQFEILRRYLKEREKAGIKTALSKHLLKISPVGDEKYDINNRGPLSIDFIGESWEYPEASYEEREKIWKRHVEYTRGLLWFLKSDSSVPENVRQDMKTYAWPADEFIDTGHFPHQLYIREARRMVGPKVMTLHDLHDPQPIIDSIGMGSYGVDSHHVQRVIFPNNFGPDIHGSAGKLQNEGNFLASASGYEKAPYPIPYRAITPRAEECGNLLVTFCVSASHVAFSSIRMEPVHMALSQAAATAAAMAIDKGVATQKLDTTELQNRLLAEGMVLKLSTSLS